MVPTERIRTLNTRPTRRDGEFVLYWMTSARRARRSFALDRAVEWSKKVDRPLIVLEALRADYPWASARFHRYVLAGMNDNAVDFAARGVCYHPYVEPEPGAGRGLVDALADRACVVVTDDFPGYFLGAMTDTVGARLSVRAESVDGNGILPMRVADRVFPTAYSFRRFLQKRLRDHLEEAPRARPLTGDRRPVALPPPIVARWPAAVPALLAGGQLDALPVSASVPPVSGSAGPVAARRQLSGFIEGRLKRYDEDRNQPELSATSGLSPSLHFGHVSSHEVLDAVLRAESWSPECLSPESGGKRSGWWGLSASAEAFLDQVITWRELGFNRWAHRECEDGWESLPEWARATLDAHAGDRREFVYSKSELAESQTHDSLWNAAQVQLVREGVMHNYLRMLWGKKILEWTRDPREALEVMVDLNNRYALDGRDPNSYSGILWVLGQYDRPWGPERPIFGKVRYMSSENTARKRSVRGYLRRYQ